MRSVIPGLLVIAGAFQFAQAGWLYGKAWLAQVLLERSWSRTVAGEIEARPWPWADTSPVAKLRFSGQESGLVVLEGASGRVLAFAPGWLHGTASPGEAGTCVVAGHRDTHFSVLERISEGDPLILETSDGGEYNYRVSTANVVHESDLEALECGETNCLVLVTCWPFDAIRPGGPMRFVVHAPEVSTQT